MILSILLLSLFLLLAGVYIRFSKDLFSPPVILISVYIISIAVAIINIPVWHADISLVTAGIIFTGLFAFLLGSLIAIRLQKNQGSNSLRHKEYRILGVGTIFFVLSITFMLLLVFLYNNYVNSAAQSVIGGGIDSTTLELYRNEMISGDIFEPTYITVMKTIGGALSMFYLLIFINNYVGGVRRFKLLIPVALYSLVLVLSSGRIGFIYLIVAALVFLYLSQIRMGKKVNSKKYIKYALFGLVLFLGLFLWLGTLTNKTQQQADVAQNISIYVGSSIVAFDDYVTNPDKTLVEPGSETLQGISNLLERVGVGSGDAKSRFLEFRYVEDMPARTNIYTSLRRLIHDYGFYGMLIIQLISGYLITKLYLAIRANRFNNIFFAILIYALLIQYISLSSIDERIVLNLFTVSTILTVLVYMLLTRYVLKTTKKMELRK